MDNDFPVLSDQDKQSLMQSSNKEELSQIIDLFNQNLKKKEILRAGKLSELQDKIIDQAEKRLTKYSDEFSNKDLIDFFKTFQTTLQNTDKTLEDIPQISITQNQLNLSIEPPEFDQDSRQRILNAVKLLLNQQIDTNINEGVITVNEE